MTSSPPSFAQHKNVNISKTTKKDISKKENTVPLYFEILLNKQLLFFTSKALYPIEITKNSSFEGKMYMLFVRI